MIDNPQTLLEFMQNFKFLTEGDLLEHEEFYTEENLLRVFGAEEVVWQFNDAGRKKGYLGGFEKFVPKVNFPNGNVFEGMSLSFFFRDLNGHFQVRLGSGFSGDAKLSFIQIQDVFGFDWKLDEHAVLARAMQLTRCFTKPTHEMGNSPIIYELNSPSYKKSIAIELAHDGRMYSIDFSVEMTVPEIDNSHS